MNNSEIKITVINYGADNIEVKNYLTYAQIQKIIETTIKYQTWAERQTNIDLMVLCYVTNFSKEQVEKLGIDYFVQTGLLEKILDCVNNYSDIFNGINYHESFTKAIIEISKNLPQLKEVIMNELHK